MADFISDDEMNKIENSGQGGASGKHFISDDEMGALESQQAPGMLESLGRGAAQGVSGGFQDELEGVLAGAGRAVGLEGFGGNVTDIHRSPEGATIDWDKISGAYSQARDKQRGINANAQATNPGSYGTGEFGGAIGSNILAPGLNAAKGAGLAANVGKGALQGALVGAGHSDADNIEGLARDTGIGAALGGAGGAAAKGIEVATPYISNGISRAGQGIKNIGGKLMEKATGATGKQSEKFIDGAGTRLIEEGFGRAFDDPAAIAARAERALNESGSRIGSVLDDATASGSKIDLVDFLDKSEKEVMRLREAGNGLQADALEARTAKVIEDAQRLGKSEVSPSYMENVKRESQANINYNADTKPTLAGKKDAAFMQRQAVEDAVGDNPAALEAFKKDKDLYGFLAPVQEAAQRRANTLNQSPIGGLLDVATGTLGSSIVGGAAGYGSGGDLSSAMTGAALGAVGRRYIAPRIASTVAVGMHNIGELVQKSPQMFGKYASVLQQAAQRGPQGVASTHFILQQLEPDYRVLLNQVADGDEQH